LLLNMIPKAFDYCRPKTLPEAISLLQQHGDAAKILSGGQSLIPMMKMRLAQPEYLIDINQIGGLDYIKEADGYLKIGALTREADLEASDLIRSKYPLILDTAFSIADPQVRNLATVGGNLAHGDPANDHPYWPPRAKNRPDNRLLCIPFHHCASAQRNTYRDPNPSPTCQERWSVFQVGTQSW
jgi:xanthine dehydrogenase iron-sulfur cluster and FAD-binding subunit A